MARGQRWCLGATAFVAHALSRLLQFKNLGHFAVANRLVPLAQLEHRSNAEFTAVHFGAHERQIGSDGVTQGSRALRRDRFGSRPNHYRHSKTAVGIRRRPALVVRVGRKKDDLSLNIFGQLLHHGNSNLPESLALRTQCGIM